MTRARPSSILIQSPIEHFIDPSRDFIPKHIRFAPLPEPGHEEHASDGIPTAPEQSYPDIQPEELTASSSSSSSSSANSTSLILDPEKSSPGSSSGSSPIIPSLLLTKHSSYNSILDNHNPATPLPSESRLKKTHSFLRPFKRFSISSSSSSSNTLTPTASIDHTRSRVESSPVNLYRTSSRESSHTTSSRRWSGIINIPLARSSSIQSHKSTSSPRFPLFPSSPSSPFSFSSESKPKPKAKPIPLGQQQRNRHKGAVILNGRVYGGPKNDDLFANARDEEPEFVEWGYGGMGSINGAKSAGVSSTWDRLHGGSVVSHDDNSKGVGVGGVGAGMGATNVEIDDDGSGMAWLKKRKMEKERKAREQKEKEENEARRENGGSHDNTPIPRSPTMETIVGIDSNPSNSLSPRPVEKSTTPHIPPAINVLPSPIDQKGGEDTATKYSFPTPKAKESETSPLQNTHESERVLQAVKVPVRSSRPTHHRSGSKGSRDLRDMSLSTEGPQVQVFGSPILVSPSGDKDDTTDAPAGVLYTTTISPVGIDKPALAPTSFSSSSESSEDDGEDDEEDEDEEQEEELQNRTALLRSAAGVEKISRHNKE